MEWSLMGGCLGTLKVIWLRVFCGKLGDGSMLKGELLAIARGLQHAHTRNEFRVSEEAVKYVHEYLHKDHPLADLISDCKRLFRSAWDCKLMHVSRCYNVMVNYGIYHN